MKVVRIVMHDGTVKQYTPLDQSPETLDGWARTFRRCHGVRLVQVIELDAQDRQDPEPDPAA